MGAHTNGRTHFADDATLKYITELEQQRDELVAALKLCKDYLYENEGGVAEYEFALSTLAKVGADKKGEGS